MKERDHLAPVNRICPHEAEEDLIAAHWRTGEARRNRLVFNFGKGFGIDHFEDEIAVCMRHILTEKAAHSRSVCLQHRRFSDQALRYFLAEVMRLKYNLSLVVLLSVLGTSLSWAQTGPPLRLASEVSDRVLLLGSDASEQLLEQGRAQVLDFRLYEAERTFRRLDRQPDGSAAARYYLVSTSFLKALVTDERVYFDEFYERYDSLRLVLEDLPASRWKT